MIALAIPAWLIVLGLGLAALLPRTAGLNDFYTIDEGYHWPGRVERFSNALAAGDWAATNQSGHPGVTTMWLGALGRQLAFTLGIGDPGWAGGGATYLALLRLPLAIVNSLAILGGYVLLRRLLGRRRALVACLLWASTPFVVAYSRILHLDALLTSFITLSLLALLAAYAGPDPDQLQPAAPHWWLLVGSGVCAGLAFLTKAPALILLPVAGLTLAGLEYAAWARLPGAQRRWGALAGAVTKRYAAWLSVALLVFWMAWPAMWVAPREAVGAVVGEIFTNGGQPHDAGNFFFGRPVADPGPLFYLVVLALRSDPVTLAGLAALLAFGLAHLAGRPHPRQYSAVMLALAGFVAFFTLVMSAEPKKLDRYLLPIWPALEVLAACGLVALGEFVQRAFAARRAFAGGAWPGGLAIGALLCWQSMQLAALFPYMLAFYNPLMGGGPVAARTILVGIGEGMDQVGAWLRARPDLQRGDVLSWIPPTLAPFLPDEVLVRDLRPQFVRQASSYAVLYIRSVQHKESPAAEQAVRATPPLYVVQINGIPYAEIHQLPRPFAVPTGATFGDAVLLRGYSQAVVGSTLVITPSWSIERSRPGGARVFVHVLDAQGRKVGQVDAAIDQGMFANWQAGQQFDSPLPIGIPADAPPGQFRVLVGLVEPDGSRMSVTRGATAPPDVDGPHVIELVRLAWPPS